MPGALLRPFPIFVLAAAAASAGVVGFTASAGIRDDMVIATIVAIVAAAATRRDAGHGDPASPRSSPGRRRGRGRCSSPARSPSARSSPG